MDRSGALKITAIFIVFVLGISTVAFGLVLASDPNNATAATTDQHSHGGSTSSSNAQCRAPSLNVSLGADMSGPGSVEDTAIAK
jgi:hypothetical protein